jgi:hypothetical protein
VSPAAQPVLAADLRRAHDRDNDAGRAFERTVIRSDGITKLARYETTLDPTLQRACIQLPPATPRRSADV